MNLSAAIVPVTDSNVLSGLTRNNWVTQAGAINSMVNGASLTLGFNGTQQVTLQVDDGHQPSLLNSKVCNFL